MTAARFVRIARTAWVAQRLGRALLDACPRLCGPLSKACSPELKQEQLDERLRELDQRVADGLGSVGPSRSGNRLGSRPLSRALVREH